jgi:beta-barrel assembly-enhancing protease
MLHGIYFNGQSSKPYKAEITITDLYILIHILDDDERQTIQWEHEEVHTTDISGSNKVSVKYGEFPYQSIELDAADFFSTVKEVYPAAHYIRTPQNFFLGKSSKILFGIGIAFLAIIAIYYFFLLPLAAKAIVGVIPIDTEIDLGKKMSEGILEGEKVDPVRTASINRFYKNLKTGSKYPIRISVVQSDVKNAFAIPGGQIVVYTGLLNEMNDYSELVALLGHEKAHVEERHSLQMLTKSLGLYIVASLVFQDVNGITAVLVDNASSLQQLSYNRAFESEADDLALQLIVENDVDPKGMSALFSHLKADEEVMSVPEFLSTHPNLNNRIEVLKEKLPQLKYQVTRHPLLEAEWKNIVYKK